MSEFEQEKRKQEAAEWLMRCDRGLTAEEQDGLFDWIADHPDNPTALEKCRRDWKRLNVLSSWMPEHGAKPNPDLLAPPSRSNILKYVSLAAGAAAVFALLFTSGIFDFGASGDDFGGELAEAFEPENRAILDDGSVVKLKGDAEVDIQYSLDERRIILNSGEAFFIVAKNPLRPFVVEVGGVEVSALGTAFNVRVDQDSFEVLVSEGVVQVNHGITNEAEGFIDSESVVAPILEANQRAVVSMATVLESPEIATLTRGEIRRVLAWQHGSIDFDDMPLSEIADELNHFNETQMLVDDVELASTRFSGSVHSDNMLGFVRVLEKFYGAKADWNGSSSVTLTKSVD